MFGIGLVISLFLQTARPGLAAGGVSRDAAAPPALLVSAVAPDFRGLGSAGFAVLPPGYLFPHNEDLRLYREIVPVLSSYEKFDSGGKESGANHDLELYDINTRNKRFRSIDEDSGLRPARVKQLNAIIKRLGRDLARAVPKESFYMATVTLRLSHDGMPAAYEPHVDQSVYFTANYAVNGPGPVVYRPQGNKLRVVETPERRWSVISGDTREQLTGILSTIHSAPPVRADNRLLIQIRYYAKLDHYSRKIDDNNERRVSRVHRLLKQARRIP